MPAYDTLIVFALLAVIGLTSLAVGAVAGLLCSVRRCNRTGARRGPSEAAAVDRPEEVPRVITPSAAGRGAKKEAAG